MLILITNGLGLNPWSHVLYFTYNSDVEYLYEHFHSLWLRPIMNGEQRFRGTLNLPLRTFRRRVEDVVKEGARNPQPSCNPLNTWMKIHAHPARLWKEVAFLLLKAIVFHRTHVECISPSRPKIQYAYLYICSLPLIASERWVPILVTTSGSHWLKHS